MFGTIVLQCFIPLYQDMVQWGIKIFLRISSINKCRKLGLTKSSGWAGGTHRASLGFLASSSTHQSYPPKVIQRCCVASTTVTHSNTTPSKWMRRHSWEVIFHWRPSHLSGLLVSLILSTPLQLSTSYGTPSHW